LVDLPSVAEARDGVGRLSPGVAFAATAAILVLFAAAASAPTPLYVVYQKEWGFPTSTLTIVFAVYVFALIGSLLVLGGLSDHVGRRPVLAAAIALEGAAFVLFFVAGGVSALLIARVAQGLATGAAFSTLGATLVDLNPRHAPGRAGLVNSLAPISGLAVGAIGCGALVQLAPAPTHLVFALLLAGAVVAGVVVARMPETSTRRPGAIASLKPILGIPARLRRDVFALVPIIVASWAIGGMYLSLGPSVAAGLFGLSNHLIGGLVVTLLCGTGAVTAFSLRSWPTSRVLGISAISLSAGTALTLAGVETHTVALAGAGTVVAGIGFGASALASFGTLARIATPGERSELFAFALVIAYLAFSLPAVVAGYAATSVGLHATTVVYSLGVIAFGLIALAAQSMRRS
jgi:MFS family permease